ncbi:hypothetical protein PHISP_07187 [Aspergillus sp. HF37]|nr:hypothetical protein PHISP_07187 [Aspergillus sp. HF37]
MSFSLRSLRTARLAVPRSFHTIRPSYAIKESDTNRDNMNEVYEARKDDQVVSSKEGKARWRDDLASNSEADVKADRGEIETDDKTFQAMQDKTKNLPNREGPVNKTQ